MKTTLLITAILMLIHVGVNNLHAQVNPYLQTPTRTSIYISLHSTDSSFTKVRYGLSTTNLNQGRTGSFQNISEKIWHTVKLTGLSSDTRYYYRCISGIDSSDIYPFRSEPLPGMAGRHIRFIIFGDSRYDDTIPSKLAEVCQAILQTLGTKYGSAWYDSVNVVMHTGDIVWKGTDISRFQTEYFTGSHDYPEIQETVDDYNYVLIDIDVVNNSYNAEVYTLGKPEHPIDNQLLNVWHFRMNQLPPEKPVVKPITTYNPVILYATPMVGEDYCISSQFEITFIQGDYTTPVLDAIRDREDIQ